MGKNNRESEARKRKEGKTCFLLLEPKSLCDSGEIARRLAKCKGVKEVHLTSGKYGFVVAAETGDKVEEMTSEIGKLKEIKSTCVAVSHRIYRKACTNDEKLVRK